VLFTEFGDNALGFEALFWVQMRNMMERMKVESELRFRIDELFRDAGIVIAFPQRDVHLDASEPIPVRVVDRSDNS
jgi:small-conductance mechanosensitive channel